MYCRAKTTCKPLVKVEQKETFRRTAKQTHGQTFFVPSHVCPLALCQPVCRSGWPERVRHLLHAGVREGHARRGSGCAVFFRPAGRQQCCHVGCIHFRSTPGLDRAKKHPPPPTSPANLCVAERACEDGTSAHMHVEGVVVQEFLWARVWLFCCRFRLVFRAKQACHIQVGGHIHPTQNSG